MSSRLLLQLAVRPEWDQIDVVCQAVSLCIGVVFGGAGLRDAIAMVSSELLENAMKHGAASKAVTLEVDEQFDVIRVAVTNEIDPATNVTSLVERIDWIKSFDSASSAYAAAMQKALEDMTDGGLGLPRIAHEGGCSVTCDMSSDFVTVRAHLNRPAQIELR